jgi:hypothetical protein
MTKVAMHFPYLNSARPPRFVHLSAVALLALLALVLAACGNGAESVQEVAEGEAETIADLPEWIDNVNPPPGAESTVTQAVQVNHTAIAADRQVRLIVDGIDVTAFANVATPGLLEYDIDQPDAPVDLQPGEHEATVELMSRTPGVSEGVDSYDPDVHETIDTFSWTFTIL